MAVRRRQTAGTEPDSQDADGDPSVASAEAKAESLVDEDAEPACRQPQGEEGALSFRAVFGVRADEVASWRPFVATLYRPEDPASLAIVRIMFGECPADRHE